jgi:hypothetical protein
MHDAPHSTDRDWDDSPYGRFIRLLLLQALRGEMPFVRIRCQSEQVSILVSHEGSDWCEIPAPPGTWRDHLYNLIADSAGIGKGYLPADQGTIDVSLHGKIYRIDVSVERTGSDWVVDLHLR